MLLGRSPSRGQKALTGPHPTWAAATRSGDVEGCSPRAEMLGDCAHTGYFPNLTLKTISQPQSVARNQETKADVTRERTELNGQLWQRKRKDMLHTGS